MKTIPLFAAQVVNGDHDYASVIKRVLDSYWYILGHEGAEFEREFAQFCGVSNCISVANGTDALELALRALEIQAGDPVMLVANAGFYGSAAVHSIGANPIYIDVDPQTLTLSAGHVRQAVTRQRPKAIIATHLYGQLADVDAIVELANSIGVPVIEDCAQAHGAMRNGKRAGSFGDIACYSFYPTKNLGALGDGGAVTTNSEAHAKRLRQLKQYGWGAKYCVEIAGGRNSRLDELQAAILREKLPNLDRWNAERRGIAKKYNQAFAALPMELPISLSDDYVAHLYVVRVADRDRFRTFLKERGIATDAHYPIPDHLQPAYPCAQGKGSLLTTEKVCNEVVSLPCFPGLGEEEIGRVIEAVQQFFGLGEAV